MWPALQIMVLCHRLLGAVVFCPLLTSSSFVRGVPTDVLNQEETATGIKWGELATDGSIPEDIPSESISAAGDSAGIDRGESPEGGKLGFFGLWSEIKVELPYATVLGSRRIDNAETFYGIPYAQPPVGKLRLHKPQPLTGEHLGVIDGVSRSTICPQLKFSTDRVTLLTDTLGKIMTSPIFDRISGSEDCLTLSVQRPVGLPEGRRVPVLAWVFGGGFQFGSNVAVDEAGFLNHAQARGLPFVLVSINHRVGGFGFMPGKEIKEAGLGNLGLLDLRMGLEWIQDNIQYFGGDPNQVIVWGESSGAMSVLDEMLLYGGNSTYRGRQLFHGAILNSGSIVPVDPIDSDRAQAVFDNVVAAAGCSWERDKIECLRSREYHYFHRAANSVTGIVSTGSLGLSYLPRPDGNTLPFSIEDMVSRGMYPKLPVLAGNTEDEGTLFASISNIHKPLNLTQHLRQEYFREMTEEEIRYILDAYPEGDPSYGSPFRTGPDQDVRPGYKRLAALLGDVVFIFPRRMFLMIASRLDPGTPLFAFKSSNYHGLPFIGSFHSSDVVDMTFNSIPSHRAVTNMLRSFYANFISNLDPNIGNNDGLPFWPMWSSAHTLMWFRRDDDGGNTYIPDTFRPEAFRRISRFFEKLHL